MAFFDISPMGGIAVGGGRVGGRGRGVYRGGMPVGGINVGGMPVGGVATEASKAQSAKTRANTDKDREEFVMARMAYLMQRGEPPSNVPFSQKRAERRARFDFKEYNDAQKELRQKLKYKPAADEKERLATLSSLRRRLGRSAKGEEGSRYAGKAMPKALIDQIEALLSQNGFGVVDLHTGDLMGEGFWDDVWSGIKDVGSVALKVAPMLL